MTWRVRPFVADCGVGKVVSVTWTVIEKLPTAEGVPEIVAPASERPAGREPAIIAQE